MWFTFYANWIKPRTAAVNLTDQIVLRLYKSTLQWRWDSFRGGSPKKRIHVVANWLFMSHLTVTRFNVQYSLDYLKLVYLSLDYLQGHFLLWIIIIIGASLSEPHIDHDNGLRMQNNSMYLSMYLCIIYPVFVQTHGINEFSLLRQWSCSCLVTRLCKSTLVLVVNIIISCE